MKKKSLICLLATLCTVLTLGAGIAHASLQTVGPIDPATGFPLWYQDNNGLAVQECLDLPSTTGNVPFCTLLAQPGFTPLSPIVALPSFTNYPTEMFYWVADASLSTTGGVNSQAKFRLALEATFALGTPQVNQQVTFLLVNMQNMDNLPPSSTFTVTHPFGTFNFTTDATGTTIRGLGGQGFRARDAAVAVPLVFNSLLPATLTQIGPFLQASATAGGAPLAPVVDPVTGHAYLANPLIPTPVTGGPNGNSITITGTGIGGPGINSVTSSLFNLQGRIIGLDVTPAGTQDFGVWKVGATSTPVKTFTVTNLAGVLTGIPVITPPVGFAIAANRCTVALNPVAPGNACSFDVAFSPNANGIASGIITIAASGVPTARIPVTGFGDGIAPSLTLDPVIPFTKLSTQTISGTVTDNVAVASVQVTVNGVSQGTATITPGTPSIWTKLITLPNVNASNSISVTATDTAQSPTGGNVSAAQSATITTDTINPVVNVTAPAAGSLINSKTPPLNFNVVEANLAFTTVTVDNSVVSPVPANLGPLADGLHTVKVDAGDSAGNLGSGSSSFTVDTTPPVILASSPAAGIIGTATPVLTFSVNDSNPDITKTVVKVNGVVVPNPVSGSTTLGPFTAGVAQTLTIDATDLANNISPTKTVNFTVILADGSVLSLGTSPPTIADALIVLRSAVGLVTLTPGQFAHADVAPLDLVTGKPVPNGAVDIADALVILRKVVGLVVF